MKTFAIILAAIVGCSAVIQEITLSESEDGKSGNTYIIREPIPDVSDPRFSKVVRYAHNSNIMMYTSTNFQDGTAGGYHGDILYHPYPPQYKSMQFLGNVDTEVDQISLFSDYYFSGEELKINRSPYGGITTPIKSLAATGTSGWTLFEGTNFEGSMHCLKPVARNSVTHYDLNKLGLSTVGSLVKGCVSKLSAEERQKLLQTATYM